MARARSRIDMKHKKKFYNYYIQRKLILKIFKNPNYIKKAIEAEISITDFSDPELRLIYKWMLEKRKEGKNINVIRAQQKLKKDLGSLQKFIPFPGGE
jgi:replicative DNA helicase